MTDTERIQEIIRAKNLNNIQFCSITGISPASLSHITSNRSKPTLTILRNVINGFPDVNPEWIMMGTGPMFRNQDNAMMHSDEDINDDEYKMLDEANDKVPSLFDDEEMETAVNPVRNAYEKNQRKWNAQSSNMVNVEDVVKKTLTFMQKPQRKIVEVRIFFDDGTYESFATKVKA